MKIKSMIRQAPMLVLVALMAVPLTALLALDKPVPAPVITLKVSADRVDALYQAGETASFAIEALQDDKPLAEGQVVCVFSKDGWQPQPPQTLIVKDGKATLVGKLDEPGFLLLRATMGKTFALAGAGYDPLQLKPSMPVPDDFDQFWAAQKGALANVPIKSTLTPVQAPAKDMDAFDVQVECLGKPVSGYLGRPQNAKPKSLPAILFVHGA